MVFAVRKSSLGMKLRHILPGYQRETLTYMWHLYSGKIDVEILILKVEENQMVLEDIRFPHEMYYLKWHVIGLWEESRW